jgi:hypothetical protein
MEHVHTSKRENGAIFIDREVFGPSHTSYNVLVAYTYIICFIAWYFLIHDTKKEFAYFFFQEHNKS